LQKLAKRVYPVLQCGFRAERSTVDTIFSLHQPQEKCREQMPLYITFTKAFDPQQRGPLQNPAIDRLRTQAAELDRVLPQQHAGDCSSMAAPLSPSTSAVGSNRAASSLPLSSGFSSLYF